MRLEPAGVMGGKHKDSNLVIAISGLVAVVASFVVPYAPLFGWTVVGLACFVIVTAVFMRLIS